MIICVVRCSRAVVLISYIVKRYNNQRIFGNQRKIPNFIKVKFLNSILY